MVHECQLLVDLDESDILVDMCYHVFDVCLV